MTPQTPGSAGAPRGPRAPLRHEVHAQAQRLLTAARGKFDGDLERLRGDPCAALEDWPEVSLQYVAALEEPSQADRCSVAGAYIEDTHDGIPVVQVALASSPGRRAFTALHELGHHLQRTEDELLQGLWEHPSAALFEDLACDAFAAGVLLPEDEVSRHIADDGPTAESVTRLYNASTASRSAVCVRAAQRLRSPGHVLLLDAEGRVFFSASHDLPPLRRGGDQSADQVIRRGLATGRSTGSGRLSYRDGITGEELFIQTASMGGDLLLVLAVTEHAPWSDRFHVPSKDTGPRAGTYECSDPGCGATYTTWTARHEPCSVPPCTECGRCACTASAAEKQCSSCFLVQPAAGFDGDRCADCA